MSRIPLDAPRPAHRSGPPLVVTGDQSLLEELLRLCAAAGVAPEVAPDAGAALRSWGTASVVLLGADVAADVAGLGPVRRDRVQVVAWGRVPDELFRSALEVGAEQVSDLPRSEGWLVELLTDLGEHRPAGRVVGVLGGSGGAGATTFACALGQVAATGDRGGDVVVVDCDPWGPGVDRMLGLEGQEGFRWDALTQTTGRLGARALRDALPRTGRVGVLSWYAGSPTRPLQAFTAREALSAARRGHDTVVLDLPRGPDAVVDELAARCDRLVVVVVPTVVGVASAARLCARLAGYSDVGLVLRGHGIEPEQVSAATALPVLASMLDQRGLAESVDLGLGPVRNPRGRLGRAARAVLDTDRIAGLGPSVGGAGGRAA